MGNRLRPACLVLAVLTIAGGAQALPLGFDVHTVEVDAASQALGTDADGAVSLLIPRVPTTIRDPLADTAAGDVAEPADLLGEHAHETNTDPYAGHIPLLPDGLLLLRASHGDGQLAVRLPGAHQATFHTIPDAATDTAADEDGNHAARDAREPRGLHAAGQDTPGGFSLVRDAPDTPDDAQTGAALAESEGDVAASSSTRHAPAPATARTVTTAAATAGAGLLSLLGWALYHRVQGHSTLKNKTRRTIYEVICNRPGIGVQEIAKASGVSYSTATYHLDRLTSNRMIVSTEDGNKLRYYKNGGAFTPDERKVLPVLKNREAFRLLEAILQNPGTYRAELADELGVTATTINWHLRRLRDVNLIVEQRKGRSAYLRVDGRRILDAFEPLTEKLDDGEVADRLHRVLQLVPHDVRQGRAEAAPA